ncbi:MAG: tRNA (cytidine(56)-2'-O)-methyltransferase [archaeon]|nr:tRNA (cytidine(56)-2'-O)-methyltransferase [archaeon]
MASDIIVFRYGHRHVRDYRVTSHCCLVSRAFGASKTYVMGETDEKILRTVDEMNAHWGKGAGVEFVDGWRKKLSEYQKKGYTSVHLTMYGTPLQEVEKELAKKDKLFVIIGSQKVEKEVYDKSDYNISVTLQPHSEIAALAVFLDRVQAGAELGKKFAGAKIEVEPTQRGKQVKEYAERKK